MGNCSKKQLNANVNNDNLPILNILRINYSNVAAGSAGGINIEANSVVTLTIVGDATWDAGQSHITYVPDSDGKKIQLEANRKYDYGERLTTGSSGGDFYIDIESKYAITKINSPLAAQKDFIFVRYSNSSAL